MANGEKIRKFICTYICDVKYKILRKFESKEYFPYMILFHSENQASLNLSADLKPKK